MKKVSLLFFCFTLVINASVGGERDNESTIYFCYESCYGNDAVSATQSVKDNGDGTTTIRTTFAKTFVDNTYGTNVIGWPGSHKFGDLTGSDKLQLALYDGNSNLVMEFKIDYISSSSAVPSGFKSLGVTGGDGGMISGSASDVISSTTSLDVNFNDYGYVLTTNSPATNAAYAQNPTYPNWIYEVWYEVTVKNSAFPGGFGYPLIVSIHASPSKTGNNTECLQRCVVVTAIENNALFNFECIIYPNPTRGSIKLMVESFDYEYLTYRLYDINGVLIQEKTIGSTETEISMGNLSASIYILKVFNNNKKVKEFKIVKN